MTVPATEIRFIFQDRLYNEMIRKRVFSCNFPFSILLSFKLLCAYIAIVEDFKHAYTKTKLHFSSTKYLASN